VSEEREAERAGPKTWVYVAAAVFASFAGSLLDMVIFGGGYTLTKIGLVAGPVAIYVVGRRRAGASNG
jgi:hypothetical protein